ncbi:hypothetical protein LGK95_11565 [Clostridium algoriphilum]|uniref:hypothetical protein n=1 Tax=Clostridium algoriphilum TaxID=198347 RepID=UPI001CF0F638|nr:hypothetical protein [Clostridium algoriphilum]MCB2294156.1 hypothetical protein [Clostridium algoriphilum]
MVKIPPRTNIAGSVLKEKKLNSSIMPGTRIARGQKFEKLKKCMSDIWAATSSDPTKIMINPSNVLRFFISYLL